MQVGLYANIIPGVEPDKEIPADWLAEFEGAARLPLKQRMKYAFIKTYQPVWMM
jgi:hypothetical protein